MSRKVNEDTTAVGLVLRELPELCNDIGLRRFFVEKLGDVRSWNSHSRRDFTRAIHVVGHAEERRHFFITINGDTDDQRVSEDFCFIGEHSSRPDALGQQKQDEDKKTRAMSRPSFPSFRTRTRESSSELGKSRPSLFFGSQSQPRRLKYTRGTIAEIAMTATAPQKPHVAWEPGIMSKFMPNTAPITDGGSNTTVATEKIFKILF